MVRLGQRRIGSGRVIINGDKDRDWDMEGTVLIENRVKQYHSRKRTKHNIAEQGQCSIGQGRLLPLSHPTCTNQLLSFFETSFWPLRVLHVNWTAFSDKF
jgi:hypothetical protein